MAGCSAEKGPPREGEVFQVVDGDTIKLTGGLTVRYLGIDTPELTSSRSFEKGLAQAAKQANSELTRGRKLRLEYDEERYDQYNRLLAYVFLPDGQMLNEELVRQGLARVLVVFPNIRYQALLILAQQQAITARRGWWRELPQAQEPFYVANTRTRRFHRPACPGGKKIAQPNRLILKTPLEAYWQGFSPCRRCQP
ncbi:thermonuclease family protein [Desulfobacca acetoxidans]